jgi:hypothetical protein
MEAGITDEARTAMVRVAITRVGSDELKTALGQAADPKFQAPAAVTNAVNALRRHRDPAAAVTKPQYRAILPYVAAVLADACLTRTVEELGEHSENPTKDELMEALEVVRKEFADATIGVMLATIADDDMPASDLCFEIATTDPRFGLADSVDQEATVETPPPVDRARTGPTPEQREARREKRQRDARGRRKQMEITRRASDQVRRERKKERGSALASAGVKESAPGRGVAPRVVRQATLTPLQEEEFDRRDPLVGSVVFAWVPFESGAVSDPSELDGKSRRCVVVAASASHLLVRPGYSEGGSKSRDWRSVALGHWRQAGFERPTWIDGEMLRVTRDPEQGPVGRLMPEDWNALW